MANPCAEIQISNNPSLTSEENAFETLKACGGYYKCPKDKNGKRLGPLVGYAGRYFEEGKRIQFVGDEFYNLGGVERYPHVIDHFAHLLKHKLAAMKLGSNINLTCGIPYGGIYLSYALGKILGCKTMYVEKHIIELATNTSREDSLLVFRRHQGSILHGKSVLITEDVCNNFTNTEQVIGLIEDTGGVVGGIACFLNRSSHTYFKKYPVISVMHRVTTQYSQNDDEVREDIRKGNIVWDPKYNWRALEDIMKEHS